MRKFLECYTRLNGENLNLLNDMYSSDVTFIDPAHTINGRENLTKYFENLYANIQSIAFDFRNPLQNGNSGYVQWMMTFSHPRLNGGEDICVDGATFLRFRGDGKVCFHQDHFDLGSMLYQHIPVLGRLIQSLKRRLGT